jgi:hypothetical protein
MTTATKATTSEPAVAWQTGELTDNEKRQAGIMADNGQQQYDNNNDNNRQ